MSDAVDLLENAPEDLPNTRAELEKALLNGAAGWAAYAYGGCALVYDGDIARHYCTPSELRRVTHKEAKALAAELKSGN